MGAEKLELRWEQLSGRGFRLEEKRVGGQEEELAELIAQPGRGRREG